MIYIVTGSHGFIGTNLCDRLESEGHTLIRSDTKIDKNLFDLTDRDFTHADGIFHLACVNQEVAEKIPDINLDTNAFSCHFLAEKARIFGIPLIYTSSCSVYGQARKLPISRLVKPNPANVYSVAKLAGEHFVRISGCKYKILRLSNVYGPYQTLDNPYCGVIGKFIEYASKDEILPIITPGTQTRDYTFVDDVIDAILTDELPWKGVYNVSKGEEISVLQVASLISERIRLVAPRTIDSVKRRCLLSDYHCQIGIAEGIMRTVEWHKNVASLPKKRRSSPGSRGYES